MNAVVAKDARTKIVATVGPASRSREMLARLIRAGVDVFRINMAHGSIEEHDENLGNIRQASEDLGRPVGVLVDLAGPKIRLGMLVEDPLDCTKGLELTFVRGDSSSNPYELVSNYGPLIDELSAGDRVLLADGTVGLEVQETTPDRAVCRVVGPGILRSRQGINLPGVALSVPALTEADLRHATWAAKVGADFVSLSFVRTSKEVHELKQMLRDHGSEALVVAKIEKPEALDNLDDIVTTADAVMVARGDLGVEMDVAEMPMEQKRIITTCNRYLKPVIVATQMLDSMQHSRVPTRAEATDVANAILDGADACMLSGETAIGKFPEETVAMMNRIMHNTELSLHDSPAPAPTVAAIAGVHPITSAVVYGASRIASQLFAKLVVVATRSGRTARVKAKQRDYIMTIGVSDCEATLRRMCLFWGIVPLRCSEYRSGPELRQFVHGWGMENGLLISGDRVVSVTGSHLVDNAQNLVVVHEVP